MTTQAIQGAASLLPTPAPSKGGSSAQSGSAEAFNQVLQREVTERRSADGANSREEEQSANSSRKPAAAQAGNETGAPKSTASKDANEAAADEQSEQLSDADSASAELLALVASMMQITPQAANGKPAVSADDSAAQPGLAKAGKGKPFAFAAQDLAGKTRGGDAAANAESKITAHPDFMQAAKEAAKGSRDGAQAQFLPSAQAATPIAAIPTESMLPGQTGPLTDAIAVTPGASALSMPQALDKMQTATSQLTDKLTPPVGTPAWDQAVGQKVVWMVNGAQQSASLTLNPPDLGPMQIVLNVNNAQASANFIAAQPEVRQALEAALPKLRDMLAEAGIQLGQTNISAGTPQHGGHAEQRGQHFSQRAVSGEAAEQTGILRQQPVRSGLGMVDTFA